jgi:hypothetical protein
VSGSAVEMVGDEFLPTERHGRIHIHDLPALRVELDVKESVVFGFAGDDDGPLDVHAAPFETSAAPMALVRAVTDGLPK